MRAAGALLDRAAQAVDAARAHTLHDPARWKIQHIGRSVLDGKLPPRHGLL
ncbi:Acyl-CoA dehydrogenase; probable dibenzothiophene desulfurization enzyme [[Actinomadura] parvosata subsp. kistnae]|nr:Acyl-CoA dehydrogenase; probable dibenzothiophene desulfurization enzyme [Actinomadura parvosata subsp. kistnae]